MICPRSEEAPGRGEGCGAPVCIEGIEICAPPVVASKTLASPVPAILPSVEEGSGAEASQGLANEACTPVIKAFTKAGLSARFSV